MADDRIFAELKRDHDRQRKLLDAIGETSGDSAPLSEAQLLAFVQALNGLRLVLGTMLDVGEDDERAEKG